MTEPARFESEASDAPDWEAAPHDEATTPREGAVVTDEQESTSETITTERTLAFFADPRATDLLLEETVQKVIESLEIQRGLVDLSSVAGITIAQAFHDAGIPFDALDYGQDGEFAEAAPTVHGSWASLADGITLKTLTDKAESLRTLASSVVEVPIAEIGAIDANVMLIPAMVGSDEKLIDFSPETISGVAITQLQETNREFTVVLPPERGLRGLDDGSYERIVIHVSEHGASV